MDNYLQEALCAGGGKDSYFLNMGEGLKVNLIGRIFTVCYEEIVCRSILKSEKESKNLMAGCLAL